MGSPFVDTINARNVVVAERVGAIYQGAAPAPEDYVLDFSPLIAAASAGFVGRTAIFEALDAFAAANVHGYFEIVADAGLGKTALAAQIAQRRDGIAFFASTSSGVRRPAQFLRHACGSLIVRAMLPYEQLPPSMEQDTSFLLRLLGEAVAATSRPVWVVVDALDEAERPEPGSNPLLLPPELPGSVYLVVTRRGGGPPLLAGPGTPLLTYPIRRDDQAQTADIEAFLRARASTAPLSTVLAGARPPITVDRFVKSVGDASDGNFMYLSYLLADLATQTPGADPLELDDLPRGLSGYYGQFWSRVEPADDSGWDAWAGLYLPAIERLAVAAEPVTSAWLAAQIDKPEAQVRGRALAAWQRVLSRDVAAGIQTWRLVHRSFAEFVADKTDLAAAHAAVAAHYADGASAADPASWDDYGLRHAPWHLAQAFRTAPAPRRHALVERLVALVTDTRYQEAELDRLRDPSRLERDLTSAVRAASEDTDPRASLLVIRSALGLQLLRREQRKPEPIFDLAMSGDLDGAVRRLELFSLDVDRDWHEALLLTIAWLGGSANPDGARRIVNGIVPPVVPSPTLDLLRRHVQASLGDAPPPVSVLPPAPPPYMAEGLVDRLAGAKGPNLLPSVPSAEMLSSAGFQTSGGGFLADIDGPPLVATAADNAAFGEPLLRTYIAIHAAYGYREYRQGSLWALLAAILQHPIPEWSKAWVPALGAAALAPNRGEFSESLTFAILGAGAAAGDAAALADLETRRTDALSRYAAVMTAFGGPGPRDTWGTLKRRLAALAEVFSRLPGRGADVEALAAAAIALPYGFAGFHAPASLAIAEASEVAAPAAGRIEAALQSSLSAAHNIQDPTFCARTTARVNAMLLHYWGAAGDKLDVAGAARSLARDPTAPAFCAVHLVGESYAERHFETGAPLPPAMFVARTLTDLAAIYERPLDDIVRLNAVQGWAADQLLDIGTAVTIPDPGLPPLIAARLAALALVTPSLTPNDRTAAIRALVPVAALDPTALHTVLSRLVLAWQPADDNALGALTELTPMIGRPLSPDEELVGRLTGLPS